MKILRIIHGLLIMLMLACLSAQSMAGGKVSGRLYDPSGGGWKEFFAWHWQHDDEFGGGDYTDMGGYWKSTRNVPGLYTYGLTRMFDLGPVIKPNVLVEDGKTITVAMIWPADYYVPPDGNKVSDPHKSFAQTWVSRGGSILQARVSVVKVNDALPEVTYSIHEDGPNGKQIGPARTNGDWEHGEIKTEHGKTYCLVIAGNEPFQIHLAQEQSIAEGDAYFDGQKQEKTGIGGTLKIDRDGVITRRFAWPGVNAEWSGACRETIGQTFKAKGNGLAMFDFAFMIGGGQKELGSTVKVYKGGPGGEQVGPAKKIRHMWDMHMRNHVWARDECPLVPGETYYIEITANAGSFQVQKIRDVLADGEMYMDGKPVQGWDIETCLIEYSEDKTPPSPAKDLVIEPAGNAYQVVFDIPKDMDCSMVDIRRAEEGADPLKSKPITRLYVSADQTYIHVDRDVKPGKKYRYAVTVLDDSGNESSPAFVDAEPLSANAEGNLLVNGKFISRAQGGGGLAPGWESFFVHGGASTFMTSPRAESGGSAIAFYNQYNVYDCVYYQHVPVEKGKTYRLTAYALNKEPWNNGNVNQLSFVGIDPLGRLEPTAGEVAWSNPNYADRVWIEQTVWATAESDQLTIYLRGRAMFGGSKMETAFCDARLTEIRKPSSVALTAASATDARNESAQNGGLVVDWAYNWGDFNEAVERKDERQFPWNWYEHTDQGVASVNDLAPNYYTVGVSRAHGLGPTVQNNVWVEAGKSTRVTMDYHFDYFAEPSENTIEAKSIAQPFLGKGVSLIKAGLFFKEPFPSKSAKYEIREGTPTGPQVGRGSIANDSATGLVGSWSHGDIPLKEGQLYYLVCNISNSEAKPYLAASPDENAVVYVDGKPRIGMAAAGFVQSDPPGLISTMTSSNGGPDHQESQQYWQSFVAKGTSLALIDFVPWFETETGEFDITVGIRDTCQWDVHNNRAVKCKNGHVSQVVFNPDEIKLIPGQVYFISLANPAGKPFKLNVTWNNHDAGALWRGRESIVHWDADMNILEYASTTAAPEQPGLACYPGDGFTRLEYSIPTAPGAAKLQIRYRDGWSGASEPRLQDKLLTEIDIAPGQTGVVHDLNRPANSTRSYFAHIIDWQGNVSPAAGRSSFAGYGPILPAEKALKNAGFTEPGTHGGPPAYWDYRALSGSVRFSRQPSTAAWELLQDDTDSVVFQTITLVPGRTYRVTSRATGSVTASLGVDLTGGFDPDASSVIWSKPGSFDLVVRPDQPAGTLFLRAKGKGNVTFSSVNIEDITMR